MDLITCMHLIHLRRTFTWVKSLAARVCVLHSTVILLTLCKTVRRRRHGICKIQLCSNQSVQSDGKIYNYACFQSHNPLWFFSENAHPQGQLVHTGNHEMALQDQCFLQHPPTAHVEEEKFWVAQPCPPVAVKIKLKRSPPKAKVSHSLWQKHVNVHVWVDHGKHENAIRSEKNIRTNAKWKKRSTFAQTSCLYSS